MKRIILVLAVALTACAKDGSSGVTGPQGPAGAPAPSSPSPTAIQQIVDSENVYRETQGEAPLTPGLSCVVQAISSGTYLSSSSPGYTSAQVIVLSGPSYSYLLSTTIDQPNVSASAGNSLIDPEIAPLFLANNYRIVCTGQLVVTEDGYYGFSMSSDDGSLLYIDGALVVDNDGAHGIQTVSGTKLLQSAVTHTFQLYYAESSGGNIAMILLMNGDIIRAANFYH